MHLCYRNTLGQELSKASPFCFTDFFKKSLYGCRPLKRNSSREVHFLWQIFLLIFLGFFHSDTKDKIWKASGVNNCKVPESEAEDPSRLSSATAHSIIKLTSFPSLSGVLNWIWKEQTPNTLKNIKNFEVKIGRIVW